MGGISTKNSIKSGTIVVIIFLFCHPIVIGYNCTFIDNTDKEEPYLNILWDNGGPTDNWVLILSQIDFSFPFNAQVADDFMFDDDIEISGVHWWGNFWGVGEPFDPVDFNIYFYADDGSGNAPTGGGMDDPETTALASYFLQNISGVNNSGQLFYSVELPNTFLAIKGVKYWLVIQAVFDILPKWGRVTNGDDVHLAPSLYGCPLLGDAFWTNLGYGDMAWYLTNGINNPPDIPLITGPTNGQIFDDYNFNFSLSDPDGDSLNFRVDWGSGDPSKLYGPFVSGSIITVNHSWEKRGIYKIRAQAIDIHGAESDWTTFDVTIPKNKGCIFNFYLFNWLFEHFPNAFLILRYIVGLN